MSMEYRNHYNALLAAYCLDSDLRFGKSCSLSDSGAYLGRPLTSVLLPGILATSSENASLDHRFELLFFHLISWWFRSSDVAISLQKFISTEVRC